MSTVSRFFPGVEGSAEQPAHPDGSNHRARSRRDAALQRARSITKTIAAASVAAVVAIAICASRAVPGHATTSANSGSTASGSSTGGSTASGSSEGAQSGGLSSPGSAPVQTQQQAPVVSGAT